MKRFILPTLTLLAGVSIGYAVLPLGEPNEQSQPTAAGEQEILYWVAPMDSSYRRDKPGKSPMGMDLVPVYAGNEKAEPGTVSISPNIVQSLGVTTARAELQDIAQPITATGVVEVAEDNIIHVHPRVSGWIETLSITTDGQTVKKGDTLYTLYSPELVNAQEEYLLARSRNHKALVDAARDRLKALQFPPSAIATLDKSGKVQQQIAFPVPQDGYVTNLNIRPGFYVTPGTTMLAIASQNSVWITAEIPQRYAGSISTNQQVRVTLPAYPEQHFDTQVDFIYPELNAITRALKVRLQLDNTARDLKPNMYASVTFNTPEDTVLAIPRSALIRTAANTRVVLALGNGEFRSTAVAVGRITNEYAEITAGLSQGDEVVLNGAFLIDSESAIDADLSRITGPEEAVSPTDTQWVTLNIEAIDHENNTVTASHGPVEAWDWPGMTMDFDLTSGIDHSLLEPGISVAAELNRDTDGMVEILNLKADSIVSDVPNATVDGVINRIDETSRIMNISRGPIEKWGRGPATMDFTVAEGISLTAFNSEQTVRFTFEIHNGEFVITAIQPAMAMSHDMDHSDH
ncbi:efflux RND transporter periplasmic adaptor subunit [Alteromonas lipolytica]|uniref:Uncharacterized protein n=1 Tax=Alteromonas lipolytica TaxID=1856405 RepID=A0A1E8F9Q6_9ALTE|nr:efflux RND transporter periplasmic adaptor subunit [Alteromonas lipolytica]OFI32647.1 hypothetical protein BFC17_05705 [Alteromonas lipolytica]GGF74390.1 hemolysin D [Alteromonas lipolytica]